MPHRTLVRVYRPAGLPVLGLTAISSPAPRSSGSTSARTQSRLGVATISGTARVPRTRADFRPGAPNHRTAGLPGRSHCGGRFAAREAVRGFRHAAPRYTRAGSVRDSGVPGAKALRWRGGRRVPEAMKPALSVLLPPGLQGANLEEQKPGRRQSKNRIWLPLWAEVDAAHQLLAQKKL